MSLKKLAKSGMFGVAGLAAANPKIANKVARSGGLGLAGMLLAKKKKKAADGPQISRGPMMEDIMVGQEAPTGMRGRPVMNEVMVAEEAPVMRKGGKVKKMAKGGSASKRGDGIATQGKTKGRFI
jgi:hypothetical protein